MATKKKKNVTATKITPVQMDGSLDKADEQIDVNLYLQISRTLTGFV